MDYQQHYNELYQQSTAKIRETNFEVDDKLLIEDDQRMGLTLIIEPDKLVKEQVLKFQEKLRKIEPHQYYYPSTDIHVTLLSVISCYDGFGLQQVNIAEYTALIAQAVKSYVQFQMAFTGITASTSCLLLQGFPQTELINNLRDQLRTVFKHSQLENSIDTRYIVKAAHSTIVRFKKPVIRKNEVLELMNEFRNYQFGNSKITRIQLVYNDWYQRAEKVEVLRSFNLSS